MSQREKNDRLADLLERAADILFSEGWCRGAYKLIKGTAQVVPIRPVSSTIFDSSILDEVQVSKIFLNAKNKFITSSAQFQVKEYLDTWWKETDDVTDD